MPVPVPLRVRVSVSVSVPVSVPVPVLCLESVPVPQSQHQQPTAYQCIHKYEISYSTIAYTSKYWCMSYNTIALMSITHIT